MHNTIDGSLFILKHFEKIIKSFKIKYINFMNRNPRIDNFFIKFFPQNGFDPLKYIFIAIGIIINNDNVSIGLLNDTNNGIGADKAKSTRNKEIFNVTHSIIINNKSES